MEKKKIFNALVGAHISIAGGFYKSIKRAEEIGCTTMQIFTKSNRSWFGDKIKKEDAEKFKETLKNSNLSKIMAHTSYLINIGSVKADVEKKSISALKHELHRAEQLEIPYLVFHPGAHLGIGEEECIKKIAHNLNIVLKEATGATKVLLETTAGQGTNVGYKFEHLKKIYDLCKYKKLLGICLDTCHVFAAGYDISTKEKFKKTLSEFKKTIGIKNLKAIHLNDSKTECGSRKDRHANLGNGKISLGTFKTIMQDKSLKSIPKILETPDSDKYESEIEMLKKFAQN